jgi:phosphoenolpyruvate-protein phosphotransferase
MMISLKGFPASPGLVSGPAYIYTVDEILVESRSIESVDDEWTRLEDALEVAEGQLDELVKKTQEEATQEEAAIFDAHKLFLKDPSLLKAVQKTISEQLINIESAWTESIESYANQMEQLEDEYFRARAVDIRDVGNRVLRILTGVESPDLSDLSSPAVIIARDLTPSDTAAMDKQMVLAFCTAEGGPTSHTAILAKALNIPAIVGIGSEILDVENHTQLLIDGELGDVYIEPDDEVRESFFKRQEQLEARREVELEQATNPAVTKDGHQIEVVANVGSADDVQAALDFGAEGIGLLRTEFLYLERDTAPDEEEQFKIYDKIFNLMEDRPVVVRTLDVGGDKELNFIDLGEEANPFLGWRAIRMCLDEPELFKVQLRALLRASPGHDIRIMFPMISVLDEVRQAKALIEEARQELVDKGYEVSDSIQLGIMVEIPSVAVMADLFAREVDFFSIGTNDLTQYTMAAERTNEKVAHLGDANHPAILRQIKQVIEAAHNEGIWVGLCGELAGDPIAIPILLGLGLDEFSMSPGLIPHAKAIMRSWSKDDAENIIDQVLNLETGEAVRQFMQEITSN